MSKVREKFSNSSSEFNQLVDNSEVTDKYQWKSWEYSRECPIAFSLLRSLWESIPNPNEAEDYLRREIGFANRDRAIARRALEQHPDGIDSRKFEPESIKIIENWLKKGVAAKDICTVMRESQLEAIYTLLTLIQSPFEFADDEEVYLDIFEGEYDEERGILGKQEPALVEILIGLLMSAKPRNQPSVPKWA